MAARLRLRLGILRSFIAGRCAPLVCKGWEALAAAMGGSRKFARRLTIFVAVCLAGLVVGGVWFYVSQEQEVRSIAQGQLEAIANSKVRQIAGWRRQQLAIVAEYVRGSSAARIRSWLTRGRAEDARQLLAEFRSIQRCFGYEKALLIDVKGRRALGQGGNFYMRDRGARAAVCEAFHTRRPVLTDLHREGNDPIHLGAVAPVFSQTGRPMGAFILWIDAQRALYPIALRWPVSSRTGELLLIRREGSYATVLNELRGRKGSTSKLRIPITGNNYAGIVNALENELISRGEDDRRTDVLAAAKAVPGTNWFLVARIDANEALAAWRSHSKLVLALIGVLTVVLVLCLMAIWQGAKLLHSREIVKAAHSIQREINMRNALLENLPCAAMVVRFDSREVIYSNAYAQELGAVVGKRCYEMFVGRSDPCPHCLVSDLQRTGITQQIELERDGRIFEVRYQILTDEAFVHYFFDITKHRQTEAALDMSARLDNLTGLPNRFEFERRLKSAISATGHRRKSKVAVMVIDLDRFKLINDTLGHRVGDLALIQVSQRIQSCLRQTDFLARMGGDEFTVLLPNISGSADLDTVAARIQRCLVTPFDVDSHRITLSASIGIVVYPDDAADHECLIKFADSAMHAAKDAGRHRTQYYSHRMTAAATARVEIEQELRKAIRAGGLEVYFQPIVDVSSGLVRAAEALLRWDHPDRGLISPGAFVPVAEDSGLINHLGDFALRSACSAWKQWQMLGYGHVEVAVNVSCAEFYDPRWLRRLYRILKETAMDPERLRIEITETTLLTDESIETQILNNLRDHGIQVGIDDFGVGYSSLGRLKKYPVVHLKIDGSFISDIASSPADRAMTESIINLAHNLGATVTAEWVETQEQLEVIRSLNCDCAQGYLISPPLAPADFLNFLRENQSPAQKAA